MEHVIDCDAKPFVPDGFEVAEHLECGKVVLEKIKLLPIRPLSEGGDDVRASLKGERRQVLNACVLDWLLANSTQIPSKWAQEKIVYFFGTTYKDKDGRLHVRSLHGLGDKWWGSICPLSYYWGDSAAAIL